MYVLWSINIGVGPALVTDLVPRESLASGISLFSAATYVGGLVGSATTGYAVQHLGTSTTFITAALLPLLAVALLFPIRPGRREEAAG